jgi:hypothetical protein
MGAKQAASVLLAGLLTTMAGCGSSSSSPQSFRRDANRLCTHHGRKADAIEPRGRMGPALQKTIAVLEQLNSEFQRLTPPASDEQRFGEFLAVQRESLRELRRLQRFTARNEPKALAALKHERPRLHIPPVQALEHPTGATLAEAMSIPAVGKYLRGLEALGRADEATGRKVERLTKQLGFTACR